MPACRDLEPVDFLGPPPFDGRLAVGWLQHGVDFARGDVSPEFFERLRALVTRRFEPFVSAGLHRCDLCQFDGALGGGNLFVPDGERMFVCPELIVHYVATHRYLPPAEFQAAVMRCPDPGGRDYRVAFLRAGGRDLMRSAAGGADVDPA